MQYENVKAMKKKIEGAKEKSNNGNKKDEFFLSIFLFSQQIILNFQICSLAEKRKNCECDLHYVFIFYTQFFCRLK